MRQTRARSTSSSWLIPVALCSAVVLVAIALGAYAKGPQPPAGLPAGPVFQRVPGPPENLSVLLYMLGVGSVAWYAVAVGFPALLFAARRVNIEKLGVLGVVAASFVTIVIAVAVTTVVDFFVAYPSAPYRPPFIAYLPEGLRHDILPWIAVTAIVTAIEARRRSVQSRLEREKLRAEMAEQRLIALTGQLQPHFLFNTLQGISTLIHRDPAAADEMLGKLSDLLRDVLRHRDQSIVRLGDEITYARTYLEIAQLRFADRLAFRIDVPFSLNDAAVPLFILQPLIENALAHGIGASASGGTIAIHGSREDGKLRLEVTDDGVGLSGNSHLEEGIGLGNTRERLRASYGPGASLTLRPANGGGASAIVEIPFTTFGSNAS